MLACLLYGTFLLATRVRPVPWYFMPLWGFLAVLADGGMDARGANASPAIALRRATRWGRLVGLPAVLAIAYAAHAGAVGTRATNVPAAAEFLRRHASADDLILIRPWFFGVTFEKYYRGRTPWMTVPPLGLFRIHRYDLLKADLRDANRTTDRLKRHIEKTLASGHAVWIVCDSAPRYGAVPVELPPPPVPEQGWSAGPYLQAWRQTADNQLLTGETVAGIVPFMSAQDLARVNGLERVLMVQRESARSEARRQQR